MKTHHILNLILWGAASIAAAADIPEPPARIEHTRKDTIDGSTYHALSNACTKGDSALVRKLIADGADINMALFCACAAEGKAIEIIKELLTAGANVNATPVEHCTPLYAAIGNKRLGECEWWAGRAAGVTAYKGQADVVKLLLAAGADPHTCSSYDRIPPIIEATRAGDAATVELLLRAGADVNARELSGNSALHWAVTLHHNTIVELLLQHGAAPAIPSVNRDSLDNAGVWDNMPGTTPLHCAALFSNADAAKMLLQHGADVQARNSAGATPLICAVQYSATENTVLIGELLNWDAVADTQDNSGNSASDYAELKGYSASLHLIKVSKEKALIQAAQDNNLPKVKQLLAAGVNPNCTSMPYIETPLFNAIGEKHFAECDGTHLYTNYREGQADMVNILLKAGADPNLASTMSHTPLMEAARTGDTVSANLLLQHGAVLNSRSCTGATALHFAAAEGTDAMVQFLLNAGAAPNLPTETDAFIASDSTNKGITPLHLAALYGKQETIKHLLQAGVYVDTPDFYGNTPYFYAVKAKNESCIRILIEAGANIKHKNNFDCTAEKANL